MTVDTSGVEKALPADYKDWTPLQIKDAAISQMPKTLEVGEWNIKQICAALSRELPPTLLSKKKKGGAELSFIPWYAACNVLDKYAPGWEYEIDIFPMNERIIVKASITIHASDGEFTRSSTGEETLKQMTTKGVPVLDSEGNTKEHAYGSPATNAEGQALRRAASKFGLGRYLYYK